MEPHSETVTHDGRTYKIRLSHDEHTDSPLDGAGPVKISYRKGSRHTLGNEPLDSDGDEEIGQRIEAFSDKSINLDRAMRKEELLDPLIGLPVYTYMHSGMAMRTHPFHCQWDSGRSGYVYITPKDALEWQGRKRMTPKLANVMKVTLSAIVEEFGRWRNGECYFVEVLDDKGEVLDSCGGYIGMEYAVECGKEMAEGAHKSYLREQAERRYWNERDVVTA